LNFYLPKRVSNPDIFIKSITKYLLNEDFKENKIKRCDYITKAILLMIKDLNLNANLKWIPYVDIAKYHQKCINELGMI
jgi:hypothetical protein